MPPDIATDRTLRESRARMTALRGELTGFLAGAEDVFLETGLRVAELEQRARALVAVTTQVVTPGSTQGQDPAEQLDRELGRLESYLRASRDGSGTGHEALSRMLASTEAISFARREFEDMARTLRVVGMYIRIEASQLEVEGAGMNTVAIETRRLGDLIEPKFRAILQQTAGLGEMAARARTTVDSFLGGQSAWSARMLGETRGALVALRSLAVAGEVVAAKAVSASEQVVQSIANVLVSLQVHDATRQMIEHAIEELGAFEDDADAAGRAAVLDAGAWSAEMCETCRLVAAQLRGARERYVEALRRIAEGLESVATQVTDLGVETGHLSGDDGGASMVEQVQRGVGLATGALRDHVAHAKETTAAMSSVAAIVQGTATYVRDIQGIGTDVKIIALNALVETERVGHGGRVLAVLAQAIGTLAAEVVQRTTEVSRLVGEIADAASGLGCSEEARELSVGANLATDMGELVTRLREYHQELRSGVEALHRGSEGLRGEVDGITRRLTEQTEATSTLQRIEQALEQVGERVAVLVRPAGPGERPVRRSSMLAHYTMAAERDIHKSVLEHVGPPTQADRVDDAGRDLGDNVELF